MNPVVHFEMPAEDSKRMADFYSNAFGWKPQMMGAEMGEYVVVQTSESDETGLPLKRGRINGGFYKKDATRPAQFPSLVISVDDIAAHVKIIAGAGGTVIGEPVDIPGIGKYVSFFDTEGNRASIIQPTMDWKTAVNNAA